MAAWIGKEAKENRHLQEGGNDHETEWNQLDFLVCRYHAVIAVAGSYIYKGDGGMAV